MASPFILEKKETSYSCYFPPIIKEVSQKSRNTEFAIKGAALKNFIYRLEAFNRCLSTLHGALNSVSRLTGKGIVI
jgi:hypothetical protein